MSTADYVTGWLYAMTVNEQVNPNRAKQNHWSNILNAVGTHKTAVFAKANYSIENKNNVLSNSIDYTTPYTITAHDFRITEDIVPPDAYITGVTIEVKFKAEKGLKVKAPVGKFMIYKGTGTVKDASKGKTGWHDGTYEVYPSKTIGTSETTVEYTIPGSAWNKIKYPTKQLYNTVMGIDLVFRDPTSMTKQSQSIYMKWARIKISYELPDYYLNWSPSYTNGDSPLEVGLNHDFKICAEFGNRSHASDGTQTVDIDIPFGIEEIDHTCSTNSSFNVIDVVNGKYQWVCDGKGLATNNLCLTLRGKTSGLKRLLAKRGRVSYAGNYIYPYQFEDTEYTIFDIIPSNIRENYPSCFTFHAKSHSTDDTVQYEVIVDGNNLTDHSLISSAVKEEFNNSNNGNYLVKWELSQESQAKGISIDYYNNNSITFSVDRDVIPVGDPIEIKWTGCFVPFFNGANVIKITDLDTDDKLLLGYSSQEYTGIILIPDENNGEYMEDTVWEDHRLLTEIETDGYIIRSAVDVHDKLMYIDECTLTAYYQKPVAYIGCVPVERSHYEPAHDFDNDLVKESYKNKTYMGKKGEFDEDTSLKIKLRPRQWTTIEGLARLDRPVPVNLVPQAFEGDLLNHRGWVELYGIKGLKKTNPLWYDGEIKVSYLTHNINSRFEITRKGKVYNNSLPSLVAPVLESGEEFAEYTHIDDEGDEVTNGTGYFYVNTDGQYIYDDDTDVEDNLRTLISIDNGQFATIKSVDLLPEQAQISMEWNCTKITEDRENNIERIIQLLDSTGKTILEYEYHDFEYIVEDEYYTCKASCRVLDGEEWTTAFDLDLNLAIDIEALQLTTDNEGEVVQEEEPDDGEIYNDFMYGSTLHFEINQNKVTITDEGYNGREIHEELEIPVGNYYYNVSWRNRNTDGETEDVLTFFDFEVQESILTSDLTNKYNNLVVSSFPIIDKSLLFTRKSEEGMLYYWEDDTRPFTYIQEPFYMYFCGVDITASDGISLFNLDNSYTVFYLQNGLVRVGFNRLSGAVYLAKYDIYTRQYLNVGQLQLTNFTDFSIGNYSDDKIEVIAGTTTFVMYRGHPYVIIKHQDEDIGFTTIWNKVWAESVNDDSFDFPALWSLVNDSNLLPSCVGGSNVSKSCLEMYNKDTGKAEPYENDITIPTLTIAQVSEHCYSNDNTIFSVTGGISEIHEEIPVLTDYNGVLGDYESYTEVNPDIVYNIREQLPKKIIQTSEKLDLHATVENYDGGGIGSKTVYFYEKEEE